MSNTPRAELAGVDRAISETLDEVNIRMHGLMSSGSYHREFLGWLADRGYQVVPLPAGQQLTDEQIVERLIDTETRG